MKSYFRMRSSAFGTEAIFYPSSSSCISEIIIIKVNSVNFLRIYFENGNHFFSNNSSFIEKGGEKGVEIVD